MHSMQTHAARPDETAGPAPDVPGASQQPRRVPRDSRDSVISLDAVSFRYNGQPALKEVNLDVRQGDFLAVIGPNGGGKTTMLKIMAGLLRPQSGTVQVLGSAPSAAARHIGYVPQHVNVAPGFPISVLDTVLLGLVGPDRRGWRFNREERRRATQVLAQVDLAGAEGHQITALSGGQKQRVLIARALVSQPKIMLLDEPTANVDPQGKFCLYELLAELASSRTVVAVSHDVSLLSMRVSCVACVNRRLAFSPTPQLTHEMTTMIYGSHDHSCDISPFLRTMEDHFAVPGKLK